MDLTLFFDHRFVMTEDGEVTSLKCYNLDFFRQRYLQTFDHVRLVTRLQQPGRSTSPPCEVQWSDRVTLASLGDWRSTADWFRRTWTISRTLRREIRAAESMIFISPGWLASLGSYHLGSRPFGLEIVGDPWANTQPGALRHPLRPFFQVWMPTVLRRLSRKSVATSYVSDSALQRRYPPGPHTAAFACSDVVLPDEAFASVREEFGRGPGGRIQLIHVGSMANGVKRHNVLIDAVSRLSTEGLDVGLTLVGDGMLRETLEAQVARVGIADRVEFLGQLSSGSAVREALDAADVFVMPSLTEGLPRAMVEAMARGLPCLGSHVGGIPDLLQDSELFTVNSVDDCAQSIRQLVMDQPRLRQLSKRNLTRASDFRTDVLDARRKQFFEALRDRSSA